MHSNPRPRRPTGERHLARWRRMRRPGEFVAVREAPSAASLRTHGRWLSMTAAWTVASPPGVRVGITVSRRMSRRSIDRSLVKRIVREAFRHAAGSLDQFAARDGVVLDLSFRTRRAIEPPRAVGRPPLALLRAELRADAEAALVAVHRHFAMAQSHD